MTIRLTLSDGSFLNRVRESPRKAWPNYRLIERSKWEFHQLLGRLRLAMHSVIAKSSSEYQGDTAVNGTGCIILRQEGSLGRTSNLSVHTKRYSHFLV